MLSLALLVCVNLHRIYFAALLISGPPLYSGKNFDSGCRGILTLKMSILFRNRMIDVRRNQRELTTLSKRTRLSAIRFCPLSSRSTWSYSLKATQKMMLVTASKQWIHFLRSLRCPPTSKRWIDSWPMLNRVSLIPVVFDRARSTSSSFGTKSTRPIRCTLSKKLEARVKGVKSRQPRVLFAKQGTQGSHSLWCAVHQVEITALVHDSRNHWIMPQIFDRFRNGRI